MANPVLKTNIETLLGKKPAPAIAVAVSGGPDSMALLYLLSQHAAAKRKKLEIHALTFDHDLRAESAGEARQVGAWVKDWPHVTHHILKWKGQKPESALMESARNARYGQIQKWCVKQGISELWLGHHQTDQVETFLFRLAKGSGLDGLGAMAERQPYSEGGIDLVRPLLELSKKAIAEFCDARKIPYISDPTNSNMKYARARLRHALPALEAEGLTEDRLAKTIRRIDRAREALDFYTDKIIRQAAAIEENHATIKMRALMGAPEEMRIRVVRRVLERMGEGGYGPRLDRLEELLGRFFADIDQAKRFSLGRFLFSHDRKQDLFVIRREKP